MGGSFLPWTAVPLAVDLDRCKIGARLFLCMALLN